MNKIKLSIIFILLTILVISIALIRSQKNKLILPEFVFYDLNNKPFNNKMIASKSVVFVYVSTNCGSCDETLKLIKKLAQEQMVTEFVIVSSSDDLLASKEKYSYNQ